MPGGDTVNLFGSDSCFRHAGVKSVCEFFKLLDFCFVLWSLLGFGSAYFYPFRALVGRGERLSENGNIRDFEKNIVADFFEFAFIANVHWAGFQSQRSE